MAGRYAEPEVLILQLLGGSDGLSHFIESQISWHIYFRWFRGAAVPENARQPTFLARDIGWVQVLRSKNLEIKHVVIRITFLRDSLATLPRSRGLH